MRIPAPPPVKLPVGRTGVPSGPSARDRGPLRVIALLFLLLASGPASAQSLDRAYDALRARDYPTAIATFRQAIDSSPANPTIRKDLAYTYLKTGENSLALDQFREAMRLDP